jgi:hypothetical protein
MRKAGFSFKTTRNFGFKVSKELWATCLNNEPRNLGGGTKLGMDLKESIGLYLKNNSRISADRLYLGGPVGVAVRYLNDSKIELYKKFPHKHLVSKSCFLKYLKSDKRYKKVS